jgi:hypothetical protein
VLGGTWLLVTIDQQLKPAAIVDGYKSLADIDRGFKMLKSEIKVAPVFHRLPGRIRAHPSICFMALIIYRLMRQRLKAAGHRASAEMALAQLWRIQQQSMSIHEGAPITGVSTISNDQADRLAAMTLRKPAPHTRLSLLWWKLQCDSLGNQPLAKLVVELGYAG